MHLLAVSDAPPKLCGLLHAETRNLAIFCYTFQCGAQLAAINNVYTLVVDTPLSWRGEDSIMVVPGGAAFARGTELAMGQAEARQGTRSTLSSREAVVRRPRSWHVRRTQNKMVVDEGGTVDGLQSFKGFSGPSGTHSLQA